MTMESTDRVDAAWGGEEVPPHLHVLEVLDLPGFRAATAYDTEGTYLVVRVADPQGEPGESCWVCAAASERALDCVRNRRASPWAVLQHSATGTVQLWRDGPGGLMESVLCCAELAGAVSATGTAHATSAA